MPFHTLSNHNRISPRARNLFWKVYHNFKTVYRVSFGGGAGDRNDDGDDDEVLEACLSELVDKKLLLDVSQNEQVLLTVRQSGQAFRQACCCHIFLINHNENTTKIQNIYDVIRLLRAQELTALVDSLFGGGTALNKGRSSSSSFRRTTSGSSANNNNNSSNSNTRESSLQTLEAFIKQCITSSSPQPQLLRQKLGKDLVKWLGSRIQNGSNNATGSTGRRSSSAPPFRLVMVEPSAGKVVHRLFALFFLSSNYQVEDAVVLLRNDLAALRFLDRTAKSTPAASNVSTSSIGDREKDTYYGTVRISSSYMGMFDYALALADSFESSVLGGDSTLAYHCLHAVSDLFLPPCNSSSSSRIKNGNSNSGQDEAVTAAAAASGDYPTSLSSTSPASSPSPAPQWEPIGGDDDKDDDDDVIEIQVVPSLSSSFSSSSACSPCLSTVFSIVSGGVGGKKLELPPECRGLHDVPKPLQRLVLCVFGRHADSTFVSLWLSLVYVTQVFNALSHLNMNLTIPQGHQLIGT